MSSCSNTPLLIQLFLVYFGLPKLGIDVSAWLAAAVCLTLYSSAFLTDIWRGSVEAIPRGQWDGSASLGLHYISQLRLVILPPPHGHPADGGLSVTGESTASPPSSAITN
jgi:polar amino acid transport system permease protein